MPSRRDSRPSSRPGSVTVEMAICVSLLFLFVFTAVEFSRMNMIRHSVDNAAYEAARCLSTVNPSTDLARETAESTLRTIAVRSVDVDIDPETVDNATREVTVTVTVPASANGYLTPHFFRDKQFVGLCRLTRDNME